MLFQNIIYKTFVKQTTKPFSAKGATYQHSITGFQIFLGKIIAGMSFKFEQFHIAKMSGCQFFHIHFIGQLVLSVFFGIHQLCRVTS